MVDVDLLLSDLPQNYHDPNPEAVPKVADDSLSEDLPASPTGINTHSSMSSPPPVSPSYETGKQHQTTSRRTPTDTADRASAERERYLKDKSSSLMWSTDTADRANRETDRSLDKKGSVYKPPTERTSSTPAKQERKAAHREESRLQQGPTEENPTVVANCDVSSPEKTKETDISTHIISQECRSGKKKDTRTENNWDMRRNEKLSGCNSYSSVDERPSSVRKTISKTKRQKTIARRAKDGAQQVEEKRAHRTAQKAKLQEFREDKSSSDTSSTAGMRPVIKEERMKGELMESRDREDRIEPKTKTDTSKKGQAGSRSSLSHSKQQQPTMERRITNTPEIKAEDAQEDEETASLLQTQSSDTEFMRDNNSVSWQSDYRQNDKKIKSWDRIKSQYQSTHKRVENENGR